MPRRILIVDDNEVNRQLLIYTLQDEYEIMEAWDGQEALNVIRQNCKELSAVLLDIMMPIMNGYEVLSQINDDPMLMQIPVIVVTGSEDESQRVKALSLGASDFISKPFNAEIIRHCLKNNIALKETASTLNAIQRDRLTGLFVREAFFQKVEELIQVHSPGYYVLSCFDIDNFKLINDKYGSVEGDRILQEIGAVIRNSMEETGGLAGRITADNFAALFPAVQKDIGYLQNLLCQKFVTIDHWSVVFSVGCYVITDKTLSGCAIYDRALLAKQSVKGRYDKHFAYFDEKMLDKLMRDQLIISNMEEAIAENQFEIWYQPQYNHASAALSGAEALVRWRHPEKGIIPPGEFIPLFEQNGFIYELDKYVWRTACRDLRRWMDQGYTVPPVSVNVSRYDIYRSDFVDVLLNITSDYHIPISLLRLEITESAFAESTKLIVDIVKQLKKLGFTVEIDDFGSGYSSLNTLKSVPVQVVKLDMRFLEDSDDEQRGGNILQSVVRMAKWLGLSLIAEGVETVEQGDFLKSIGCSYVQGYLYARPMPADQYEDLFRNTTIMERHPMLECVDHMDSNTFWNPKSMDSLIFNSFVGAACIFEYYRGEIDLVRATDKYASMLGGDSMTVENLLKINLFHYLEPENAQEVYSKIDSILTEKGEASVEFHYLNLPGGYSNTYIRSSLRVIASTTDAFLLYCISENITAQRESEKKERAGRAQLQAIMDSINCGITAVTMDKGIVKYLLANDKYYQLLGYTEEQYTKEVGVDVELTVYPEDREYVFATARRVTNTGVSASMEYRALLRDGSVTWFRSYLSIASFEGVETPVQICTYANISAEKSFVRELISHIPCGAGICELTGNDLRVICMNRDYYQYFHDSNQNRDAQSVLAIVHPEDRTILYEAMKLIGREEGRASCTIRIKDTPDNYIPLYVKGVRMQSGSDVVRIYVTFEPVS